MTDRWLRKNAGFILFGLLFIAFALRVWKLHAWLPDAYLFDDEPLMSASTLEVLEGFSPLRIMWPATPYLFSVTLLNVVSWIFMSFREFLAVLHSVDPMQMVGFMNRRFVEYYADPSRTLMLARALSVFLGTAAVWAIFSAAKEMAGEAAGLIAAALLAFSPLAVRYSHFCSGYIAVLLVFCLTARQAFSLLKGASAGGYIRLGIWTGLLLAMRFTAMTVLPGLFYVHWHLRKGRPIGQKRDLDRAAAAGLAMMGLVFVVGCPYVVTFPILILKQISTVSFFSAAHVGLRGCRALFQSGIWHGLGPLGAAVCAAGALYALIKRAPADIFLLCCALSEFWIFSRVSEIYDRYAFILLAIFIFLGSRWLSRLSAGGRGRERILAAALLAASLVGAATGSVLYDLSLTKVNSAVQAKQWIEANLPAAASIALCQNLVRLDQTPQSLQNKIEHLKSKTALDEKYRIQTASDKPMSGYISTEYSAYPYKVLEGALFHDEAYLLRQLEFQSAAPRSAKKAFDITWFSDNAFFLQLATDKAVEAFESKKFDCLVINRPVSRLDRWLAWSATAKDGYAGPEIYVYRQKSGF